MTAATHQLSEYALNPAAVSADPLSPLYTRFSPVQLAEIIDLASDSMTPPADILPSAWVEQSLELSPRVTKRPGLVRLDPEQKTPLDAILDNERVVLCWGAQCGKTLVIQASLGYFIDQDPGPCMVVYPNQDICRRRSKKHLQPLISDSPVLRRHLPGTPDDLLTFAYTLDRMDITLAWAGSPAQLASEPIRILVRDETAKFQGATATEADAMSLSERRTISYGSMRRIIDVTTPTLPIAPGWSDLMQGTYEEFHVPCPECGTMQVLRFVNFAIPTRTPGENEHSWHTRILKHTTVKCQNDQCAHPITNLQKNSIKWRGQWIANNPEALYRSFHLPSWYSENVSFGQVALRWTQAKENPESLRDVINSDFAEPWREIGSNTSLDRILAHVADYQPNLVPIKNEVLILLFIDVQQNYFWFQFWAYSRNTMYSLDYGTIADFGEIDNLRMRAFPNIENKLQYVRGTFIDARYRTQEVYEYCCVNANCTPLFGCTDLNRRMTALIRWQNITRYPGTNKALARELQRMDINAGEFAEQCLIWFASGFESENTAVGEFDPAESRFFLHCLTTEEYAKHLTRRQKQVKVDSYGREVSVWVDTHKRHDYFDLFVYALAARYFYEREIQSLADKVNN